LTTSFNRYFQDELSYLRSLGEEFSRAYPALAPSLAQDGDPDVERLLEGVAFLTGRIRQKLDDEIPEFSAAIASLLFPQFIRPVPCATMMEIVPRRNVLRERRTMPAGTEFASQKIDGTSCLFQSSYDAEIIPWAVQRVFLEPLAAGKQQLRVEIIAQPGTRIEQCAPAKLRLQLTGELRSSLGLLEWVLNHTEDVVLLATLPEGVRELSLGKSAVRHGGFEDEQSLLPLSEMTFPGFRLLQEYYTLPEKFAFVEVEGLRRLVELAPEAEIFSIAFRFNSSYGERVADDAVKMNCVPAVNVFVSTSEPIRYNHERERFLVRPAGIPAGHGEVYALTGVQGMTRGRRDPISSFYEFTHADPTHRGSSVFYATHLVPSVVGEGTDLYVSLGAPEDTDTIPGFDVLSIDLLGTNGGLASDVRGGQINQPTSSSPAYATFNNLATVTPYVPPPHGRELQWRVMAHAAMSFQSLTEPEVLRSVLSVYNVVGLVDRQAARAVQLKAAALKDIGVRPIERLYRGVPIRGVGLRLGIEETPFQGDGDLFLFGAVMDRFFAEYVSLNSFVEFSLHGLLSRIQFTWPERSGSLRLL
jgi:type VI secretion system protein ImpG